MLKIFCKLTSFIILAAFSTNNLIFGLSGLKLAKYLFELLCSNQMLWTYLAWLQISWWGEAFDMDEFIREDGTLKGSTELVEQDCLKAYTFCKIIKCDNGKYKFMFVGTFYNLERC